MLEILTEISVLIIDSSMWSVSVWLWIRIVGRRCPLSRRTWTRLWWSTRRSSETFVFVHSFKSSSPAKSSSWNQCVYECIILTRIGSLCFLFLIAQFLFLPHTLFSKVSSFSGECCAFCIGVCLAHTNLCENDVSFYLYESKIFGFLSFNDDLEDKISGKQGRQRENCWSATEALATFSSSRT